MLVWHPDLHIGDEAVREATRKAQQINGSYEVLARYFEGCDVFTNTKVAPQAEGHGHGHRPQTPPRASTTAGYSKGRRFWNDLVEHGFPDETVFEVFLESSHLVSAGYNAKTSVLYQKFHNGGGHTAVYRYINVPDAIWQRLLGAVSHGSYAIHNINYSFRYERCSEPNRPYNPAWRLHETKKNKHA